MSQDASRGEVLTAISNGLVRLRTRHYGKGPTKIRTHASGELVVSLLQGGFTRVEQTLIKCGHGATVAELRLAIQEATTDEFVKVVEEATSREVVAHLSQVHVAPDLGVELFVLAPEAPGTTTVA